MDNRTRVSCCCTGCKYNSACCANPANEKTYCTLQDIELVIDEETGILDCKQYEYDFTKSYECMFCQLEKYGEVTITPEPVFEEVDDISDLI